jgi:hypothetical protein
MKNRAVVLAVVAVGVAAILFFLLQKEPPLVAPAASVPASSESIPPVAKQVSTVKQAQTPTPATAPAQSQPNSPPVATHSSISPAAPRPTYPLEFTNIPPESVMDNLRIVFHQYASMFGGNPVGTNPEITAALNGKNPKGANFINPDEGMRINANGEMVDPWGTPFFFHQLSGTEMEIHSAGPDRIMWSPDDLVIK